MASGGVTSSAPTFPATPKSREALAQAKIGGDDPSIERKQRQLVWYNRHKRRARAPRLSDNYRRYLEEEKAFLELPRSTTDALLPIYVSLLDDLIPLIDGPRVFREHSNGQSSVYLVRALCMVVCKASQAKPFLRLVEDGPLFEPIDFATKLLEGLEAALKADLEPDRVTKVQILALMHLNNDGIGGTDRSSNYLAQAISAAWSLSLHWHVPGIPDQEQCSYLWWSLRTLDRLNKPIMGAAPFIIDDADVALGKPEQRPESYRSQVMTVSLALGDLMKRATRVYKASSTAKSDDIDDFPSLAEITKETSFETFLRSHKGYLEIWYHVTAMLSCRYSGPGSRPYIRRLASADRILEIVSRGGYESLPPLPLVPYAISMSTTMLYRALRDGQRDLERASRDMELSCGALDALSQRWTSAKGVARLSRRLWRLLSSTEKESNASHASRAERISLSADNGSRATLRSAIAPLPQEEALSSMPLTIMMTPPPASGEPQSLQEPLLQAWDGASSYTQLDTAFHDLFDYSMPNVFRDPTSWEFLHIANCDGSPPDGSGLSGGGSFVPTQPEEFRYGYMQHRT